MKTYSLLRNIVLMGILSCSFISCGDDETTIMKPILPANGGNHVISIRHLGGVTSAYDWDFVYSDDYLVKAVGTVRDASSEFDGGFTYTSWLEYGSDWVEIINSGDEYPEVVLNGYGLIERMLVNRNQYDFSYVDGRLVGWHKTIFEDSYGHVTKYTSTATIEYEGGDISRIVMTDADKVPVTYTFVYSDKLNLNGLLPVSMSKQLGCLGFEHLYYAGLLGRPTTHLVKSISVSFPDGSQNNYKTEFSYNIKNSNTVLCNYVTPNGETASVSYTY